MKTIALTLLLCCTCFCEISRSYSQVISGLESSFNIKRSSDVRGSPRYLGSSPDGNSALEIIGSRSNVKSASITFTVSRDDMVSVAVRLMYATKFLNNVCKMKKASKWISDSAEKGKGVYYGGNCVVKLSVLKILGMIIITVE